MKNLFYLSALSTVILVASCTKGNLIAPGKSINSVNTISARTACDSVKMVSFTLTGDASYEIAFSGKQNYTFSFPGTVSVKPGTYSVFVYSPGNYSQHNFYWGDQQVINQSGARWDGVTITPCTVPQSVRIGQ
ncbi:MAG TPA: hypothetical protein VGN20_06810 [Mucilaginibacter sp.]|jgi:hypothetical protein